MDFKTTRIPPGLHVTRNRIVLKKSSTFQIDTDSHRRRVNGIENDTVTNELCACQRGLRGPLEWFSIE